MHLQARLPPRQFVINDCKLLSMIFQHIFLSGEADVGRSTDAFLRRLRFVDISLTVSLTPRFDSLTSVKANVNVYDMLFSTAFLKIPARSLRRNVMK